MLELNGEVHVWQADLDGEDARTRRESAQRALRAVLAHYLDQDPAAIGIERASEGKPRLAGETDLRFNLSHSGDLAAVAVVRGREVGLDVELVNPRRDVLALAPRALPQEDAAAVAAAPAAERTALFYAAWARREACVKCLGIGLSGLPVESPLPSGMSVVALDLGPGFAAALAIEGEMPPLRRFQLEPQ